MQSRTSVESRLGDPNTTSSKCRIPSQKHSTSGKKRLASRKTKWSLERTEALAGSLQKLLIPSFQHKFIMYQSPFKKEVSESFLTC